MSSDPSNPYAAPVTASVVPDDGEHFDPAVRKKAEAIIKDAGQFWLAILICILCSGCGAIIIGPWYLVRLMQWNSLSQREPRLLTSPAPVGSLPQRFQAAKVKLIIGMAFGGVILALIFIWFAISAVTTRPAAMG